MEATELRERLAASFDGEPALPDFAPVAVVSGRRHRRVRRVGGAVAVLALVAGAAAAIPASPAHRAIAAAFGRDPEPCADAPLSVTLADGALRVRNDGDRACRFSGKYPIGVNTQVSSGGGVGLVGRLAGPIRAQGQQPARAVLPAGATYVQPFAQDGAMNSCPFAHSFAGQPEPVKIYVGWVENRAYPVGSSATLGYQFVCTTVSALPPWIELAGETVHPVACSNAGLTVSVDASFTVTITNPSSRPCRFSGRYPLRVEGLFTTTDIPVPHGFVPAGESYRQTFAPVAPEGAGMSCPPMSPTPVTSAEREAPTTIGVYVERRRYDVTVPYGSLYDHHCQPVIPDQLQIAPPPTRG